MSIRSFASRRSRFAEFGEKDDEMTVEEKNVLNQTRKNTTFNSHAPNLSVEGPPAALAKPLRLGCAESKKGPAPLITVRPFVREHTPGKVNMVSPMRNGEVVTSFAADSHEETGRGEAQQQQQQQQQLPLIISGKKEGGESEIYSQTISTTSVNERRDSSDNNSSEESGVNSDHTDVSSEGEMANGSR